jgi:hypothetical protein
VKTGLAPSQAAQESWLALLSKGRGFTRVAITQPLLLRSVVIEKTRSRKTSRVFEQTTPEKFDPLPTPERPLTSLHDNISCYDILML